MVTPSVLGLAVVSNCMVVGPSPKDKSECFGSILRRLICCIFHLSEYPAFTQWHNNSALNYFLNISTCFSQPGNSLYPLLRCTVASIA